MKRSSLKKFSKRDIPKLKRKADKLFSIFIRNRDTSCFTCDATLPYERRQAGHWISRTVGATRYDDRNVNTQCVRCNIWKYGNGAEYADRIVKRYGQSVFDELIRKSHDKSFQMTLEFLEEIINKYGQTN